MVDLLDYGTWLKDASKPGHVAVIIGRRGGGKSGLGYKILEDMDKATERPIYLLGLPEEARSLLPRHYNITDDITKVPNESIVFVDEAAIHYAAKEWHKKGHSELAKLIEIARHKKLVLIFITLNTASVDINVLRFVDSVLFKPMSLLQLELERQQMKKIIAEAQAAFAGLPKDVDPIEYTYVISNKMRGLMKTILPEYWSDQLSTSYKSYDIKEGTDSVEVPILGGLTAGRSQSWACQDCKYWHEPEDADEGWCSVGFADVPRHKCDSRTPISKKPKKILNQEVRVPKKFRSNPPLVNISLITMEIPKQKMGTNSVISEALGPASNPPEDPPTADKVLEAITLRCDAILKNPQGTPAQLKELLTELESNAPLEVNPKYSRTYMNLVTLIALKEPRLLTNPPSHASHIFSTGTLVRLREKDDHYLKTIWSSELPAGQFIHMRLLPGPGPPNPVSPHLVYTIGRFYVDDTGTEYFDLHYPTLKAIGCWGIYDKIHIDDLNKFVKITAGEEKKRTEQYWNDRLKTLKVNEWDAFEKELLEVSRTLIVNLAFFDIVSGDRVAVWVNGDNLNYTIPREIRWGAPYSVPISEVSKKFVIRDCGCELYRQKHNLNQLFK